MKEFAEIFKSMRKERRLTQEQVAESLGVSPQAISRWETAASLPDIALLPSIASYFDTSADALLGIRKPVRKQKLIFFQFRHQLNANEINQYLEDGWTVKDMNTHALSDGCHPEGVVILEKVENN